MNELAFLQFTIDDLKSHIKVIEQRMRKLQKEKDGEKNKTNKLPNVRQ